MSKSASTGGGDEETVTVSSAASVLTTSAVVSSTLGKYDFDDFCSRMRDAFLAGGVYGLAAYFATYPKHAGINSYQMNL